MSAILYLYKRRLINWIKQSVDKPARLVLILVVASSAIGMFLIPFPVRELEGAVMDDQLFRAILMPILWAISLLIMLGAIFGGAKSGSLYYSMADVHFLFSSPFRPQNVLLYGMLNMMSAALFGMVFMVFQYPNISRTGISRGQFLGLLLVVVFGVLIAQMIQQTVYLFSSLHPKIRPVIRYTIIVLLLGILISVGVYFLVLNGHLRSLLALLENQLLLYAVPVLGWFVIMLRSVLEGIGLHFFVALGLLLLVSLLGVIYSYGIEPDFYEDQINATIKRTEREARAKSRGTGVYIERKYKVRKRGLAGGWGESAIFFMHIKEYRRMRPFFISFPMVLYFIFGSLQAIGSASAPADISPVALFFGFVGIVGFSLFFFGFDSPLLTDLKQSLFYYMPGNSLKKVLWSSFTPVVMLGVDLIPSLVINLIFAPINPLIIIVGFIAALSFYLPILSAQLITFRIMGSMKETINQVINTFLLMLLLAPGIFLLIAGGAAGTFGNSIWYISTLGGIILVHIIIFVLGALAGRHQLRIGMSN